MTLLKTQIIRTLSVSILFLSASMASAQAPQEISKDKFLETYINALKQSGEIQKESNSMAQASMRENMSEEQYKQYEADLEKMEAARKEGMAKCMGITTQKIDSITQEMDAEFQIKSVKQCSPTLPAKISSAAFSSAGEDPQLKEFAACLEGIASKKTGIPLEKLKQCAQ